MFDRYTRHERRYGGPDRVDVHEHRAPTDESAKMLRELESAALKRVVQAHVERGNELSAACVEMQAECATITNSLHVAFKLNGRDYSFAIRGLDTERYLRREDGEGLVTLICEKMAEVITHELLKKVRLPR